MSTVSFYLCISTLQSVPNIFVQGVHLGGSDDLSAARENGRLASMMKIKP